jgi:hypothetical protein
MPQSSATLLAESPFGRTYHLTVVDVTNPEVINAWDTHLDTGDERWQLQIGGTTMGTRLILYFSPKAMAKLVALIGSRPQG